MALIRSDYLITALDFLALRRRRAQLMIVADAQLPVQRARRILCARLLRALIHEYS